LHITHATAGSYDAAGESPASVREYTLLAVVVTWPVGLFNGYVLRGVAAYLVTLFGWDVWLTSRERRVHQSSETPKASA
jgi:hypothetical protein